jgi:hypothetical protein
MTVWNLPGQETIFTRENITDIFRDSIQSYISLTNIAAIFDFTGPLTAPLYIRLTLKMAADLILVFQQLFWTSTRQKALRMSALYRQLWQYRESNVRETVHRLVDGSIGAFDIVRAFQISQIQGILRRVVEGGQGSVLEELRRQGATNGDGIPLVELPA